MKTQSKEEALELLEEKRSNFLSHCRQVALSVYLNRGEVTIDDVRRRVELPKDIDGRVFGAVFNTADWEKVGYTTTKIKTSHRRPIGIFKLK